MTQLVVQYQLEDDQWATDIEVEVTHYQPLVPAKLYGAPEDCYPEEGGDIEFFILDPDFVYLETSSSFEDAVYEAMLDEVEYNCSEPDEDDLGDYYEEAYFE